MKEDREIIRVAMIPFIEGQLLGEEAPTLYRPAMPVRLRAGRFVLERYALIDTGARVCSIDRRIIEKEASVDLAEHLVPLSGPEGVRNVPFYNFDLDICGPEYKTIRTLKQVSFAAVELPLGYDIVLGWESVLEKIKLTIDYPKRQVEIEFPGAEEMKEEPPYLTEARSLIELGSHSAGVATMSAVVERALMDMAQDFGILPERERAMTLMRLAEALHREGILDDHTMTLLSEFAELRNKAVHGLKPLPISDALHALKVADHIMILLEAKRREKSSSLAPSEVITLSEKDMAIEYVDNLSKSTHKKRGNLFTRAMEYKERGLYSDASGYLLKALHTGASGSEKVALLILLGTTRLRSGKLDEAMDLYRRAAEEANKVQDRFGLIAAFGNLGIASMLANDLVDAQRNLEMAIAMCEQTGFNKGKASLLANLANVNLAMGRQKAADRYFHAANALVKALEERDHFISQHSLHVADLTKRIAKQLGLSTEEIDRVQKAALLHDIGKIVVPDRVLQKRGAITDSEFAEIKSHSIWGAEIMGKFEEFKEVIPIIRSHHEHYDGSGYPEGLKGDEIPLEARILAMADAFAAMTSNRSYAAALSIDEAREELLRDSGRLWDPKVVEAFISLMSVN